MKTFSIQLKKARLKNNMTQKEAASALGISLVTYQHYEALGSGRRTPRPAMILKIAELFEVDTDFLFGKR